MHIERNTMRAFTPILTVLCLAGSSHGLHNELTPLRGYHCKDDKHTDVHEPCVLCPPGFYCPDEYTKKKCGSADVYCPLGSMIPTPVPEGHYTVDDVGRVLDERVAEVKCEKGFYCSHGVKRVCPKGHYCNQSGMSEPIPCGDSSVFCREGSVEPQLVAAGYYSIGGSSNTTRDDEEIAPKGHFAKGGILLQCPSGHFGDELGLSTDDCSGVCDAGWYCPIASISPRQVACGNENVFCPKGSSKPTMVRRGYYTTDYLQEPCRPGKFRVPLPAEEVDLSSVNEKLRKDSCISCPAGTHKPVSGDSVSLCLDCGPKTFTTDNINCECYQSATDKKKSTKLFYDWTSGNCVDITDDVALKDFPDDFHEAGGQFTKAEEHPCDIGHYCEEGIRYKCPSGTFGDKEMEVSPSCGGDCEAGYFCPEASTSPTQIACGSVNVYCPSKSSTPTYVSPGYYLNENESFDKKTSQLLCPPGYYCPGDGLRYKCPSGRFGESSGQSDEACDGECKSGYFCEAGSISPFQSPCGNATVFCPKASSIPTLVDLGYYSASEVYSITANYAGPNATHDIQRECEVGYYCHDGIKYYCPQGTFGVTTRSTNLDQCEECTEGFYCRSQPAPPTTEDTQVECGDASKFCPKGSAEPRDVDLGYYTLNRFGKEEGLETQRTSQVVCPPGYYCQNGLKFKCKEGTYGETSALFDDNCSGFCPRGFFCPENTVHPIPCSPGSYASGGAKECTSCEVPLTVPMEVKNSMCRNDRSCCFEYN